MDVAFELQVRAFSRPTRHLVSLAGGYFRYPEGDCWTRGALEAVHGEVCIRRIHRRLDPHLEVMSLMITKHGPARGWGKAKKAMIRHGLVPREERGAVVMYEA